MTLDILLFILSIPVSVPANLDKESPEPLAKLVGRENIARLKSAAQKQIKISAMIAETFVFHDILKLCFSLS